MKKKSGRKLISLLLVWVLILGSQSIIVSAAKEKDKEKEATDATVNAGKSETDKAVDKDKNSNNDTLVSYAMLWNQNKNIKYSVGGPIGRGKSLEEGDTGKLTCDCSGFVAAVFQHYNISGIPTQSESFPSAAKKVITKTPQQIDNLDDCLPGDVVKWNGHVGLYIGDGKYIHINEPSSPIHISSLKEARRVAEKGETTYFCRMLDDNDKLMGTGKASQEVAEATPTGNLLRCDDITGMPTPSSLAENQALIELFGTDDLALIDSNSLEVIKGNMDVNNKRLEGYFGVFCAFIGMACIIYSILLVVAMIFDYVNAWIDISLIEILSFHRWMVISKGDVKDNLVQAGYDRSKGKSYITIQMLGFRAVLLFVTGCLLVSGMPTKLISWVSLKFVLGK